MYYLTINIIIIVTYLKRFYLEKKTHTKHLWLVLFVYKLVFLAFWMKTSAGLMFYWCNYIDVALFCIQPEHKYYFLSLALVLFSPLESVGTIFQSMKSNTSDKVHSVSMSQVTQLWSHRALRQFRNQESYESTSVLNQESTQSTQNWFDTERASEVFASTIKIGCGAATENVTWPTPAGGDAGYGSLAMYGQGIPIDISS